MLVLVKIKIGLFIFFLRLLFYNRRSIFDYQVYRFFSISHCQERNLQKMKYGFLQELNSATEIGRFAPLQTQIQYMKVSATTKIRIKII